MRSNINKVYILFDVCLLPFPLFPQDVLNTVTDDTVVIAVASHGVSCMNTHSIMLVLFVFLTVQNVMQLGVVMAETFPRLDLCLLLCTNETQTLQRSLLFRWTERVPPKKKHTFLLLAHDKPSSL